MTMTTNTRSRNISRLAEVRSQLADNEGERTSPRMARPTEQLRLVDTPRNPWDLDDATKAAGIKGVANARAILRAARPVTLDVAA